MVVSRSRTIAPGYGELTLDDVDLEKVQSLRILGITLDSRLKFETHLQTVVPKAAKSLGVLLRAGHLYDCLFQCICVVQHGVLCPRVDVVEAVLCGFAG